MNHGTGFVLFKVSGRTSRIETLLHQHHILLNTKYIQIIPQESTAYPLDNLPSMQNLVPKHEVRSCAQSTIVHRL